MKRRHIKFYSLFAVILSVVVMATDANAGDCGCLEPVCGCEPSCDLFCCESLDCDGGCDSCCVSPAPKRGCGAISSLLGMIQPSDRCFDDFISPMIDFVHFEDPRTLTELRPIFVNHNFPGRLGPAEIPAGGNIQLIALQFRVALTERLSLIGVKDGYIVDNSNGALDGLLNSGWADITAGLKYNFLRDAQSGTLLSGGFTYEIPLGSEGALQSVGDGEFHFFATGGQRFADGNAHFLSSFGWQLPVDQSVQSTTVHWNNHFDVRVTDMCYLFTENSWRHWVDDADHGLALGVSGQDLINLGSTNVDGNDLVTHNLGVKVKPRRNVELGFAYEFPLTGFKDVIEDRYQVEAIFRY